MGRGSWKRLPRAIEGICMGVAEKHKSPTTALRGGAPIVGSRPRYHWRVSPAPASERCFALVPCAGIGERAGLGGPKQYAPLAGRALVAHTLAALQQVARLQGTLVVLAAGDTQFAALAGTACWVAHCGGATRAATVANGLAELQRRGAGADDWVLVHDAARCLLHPAWVDRLIDACQGDAVGGLLALPLADTLKQAEAGRVQRTLPRDDKWAAQTPQMFRLGLLRQALARAGDDVTDEASAIEALGHAPLLVPGELENFKVTWPQDLALAERLLATRGARP
jgi:2-C-methyl-D-erythritol 4-phosphate cytidylyltransferase